MFCSWLSVSNAVHKYKVRIKGIHNDVTSQVCFDSRSKFHHFYHYQQYLLKVFSGAYYINISVAPSILLICATLSLLHSPFVLFCWRLVGHMQPFVLLLPLSATVMAKEALVQLLKMQCKASFIYLYSCLFLYFLFSLFTDLQLCSWGFSSYWMSADWPPTSFAVNNCSFDQSGSITDK